MSILPVGIGPQEGGYQIERSLRFNSADSAYLSRTPASTSNRQKWTISFWVKFTAVINNYFLGAGDVDTGGGSGFAVRLNSNSTMKVSAGGGITINIDTVQVFRDPSAWYHIVIAMDTTQATASNRVKIYVNGVQASLSATTYPAQNTNLDWNNSSATSYIGAYYGGGLNYSNCYLTEIHSIDGQQLDPTSFGEYNSDTGVWQPKAYTGSYGTNGFYLDFADNSSTTALGYDAAGSNDWTPNNFSVTAGAGNDSVVDTPTPYGTDTGVGGEVRGNYATANPLKKSSTATLTNGNLDVAHSSAGGEQPANFAVSSGKWYWEATPNSAYAAYGIILTSSTPSASSIASGYHYYAGNGQFYTGTSGVSYGATFTNGDVIGVALDLDTNQITFYKNGTSQGAKSISAGEYYPDFAAASTNTTNCNFGQRPFSYTAPSGFKALCTQNLPEPTILDGGDYFNTVLYSGNSSTQAITGVGFQPDWIWIKSRSNGALNHALFDVLRGTPRLDTSTTVAEGEYNQLNTYDSDGFTLKNETTVNGSGNTYVAWNWKAGGTGVTNTAGTITSTVSANPTAGFSIVTYTGNGNATASIGHGLSAAPRFVMCKKRSGIANWTGYHASIGKDKIIYLSLDIVPNTQADFWGSSGPSSSVINFNADGGVNANGDTYVCYAFAPVEGFSAFGSYTGNGSSDGPFVFCNFRPRFILLKKTSGSGDWNIRDTSRSPYNVVGEALYPNLSYAEYSGTETYVDILSNGFKLRGDWNSTNASGGTYIYAAFAEVPFSLALAR